MINTSEIKVLSIEAVWKAKALLGEGVLYDPRFNCMMWLDIKGETLFRLNLKTKKQDVWSVPGQMSALGLSHGKDYICVLRNGFHHLKFSPEPHLTFITDPENNIEGNRFNDGAVDPFGGFWAGTMDDSEQDAFAGTWWRLAPDGQAKVIQRGFHVTNGPVFDPKRALVYFTDSARQIIYRGSISEDGSMSEMSPFITFSRNQGYPDGMAIDREGILWIAFWDGWCLRRISPEGHIVEKIDMPVPRPTKVSISDDGLYVSSASIGLDQRSLETAPLSGSLFHMKLSKKVTSWHHLYGECERRCKSRPPSFAKL